MQPVLEIRTPDGFTLWPTGAHKPYEFLVLDGTLTPEEVGTAVWLLAATNDVDPEEGEDRGPRPDDPLGALLHGLLTMEYLFAPGGFRVTDTTTGAVLEPGCCNGLEEWRDWLEVTDGCGEAGFGHDPDAGAERLGRVVRLTADTSEANSPVIELPVEELRRLIAGAEQDLRDFVRLAGGWAELQLPERGAAVTAALARALDLEDPA
ncbi:hypothetical protein ACGF12_25025 [Kitasatospora sp. NPDC048296]|uniref:hypothetical protein n=1 Tax=Kitasatospora sp. NPDC048296 TaxID=3364048 RepID=UPI00371E99C5